LVRETRGHAHLEATHHGDHHDDHVGPTNREIFSRTSFSEPALSSACLAGLVNNLNFGLSWGLFPLLFATTGTPVDRIGVLVATYPAVWGAGQILTGALSDRWGRKHLITAGMLTQATALALIATGHTFPVWLLTSALLGAGTAMVYPTLLAAVGDVAHPLGGPAPSGLPILADIGYAAAPSSAALPPTCGGCGPPSGLPRRSPWPRVWSSRPACMKHTHPVAPTSEPAHRRRVHDRAESGRCSLYVAAASGRAEPALGDRRLTVGLGGA
jgi:hypothetical protein